MTSATPLSTALLRLYLQIYTHSEVAAEAAKRRKVKESSTLGAHQKRKKTTATGLDRSRAGLVLSAKAL